MSASFTTTILVDKSPDEAIAAIIRPRHWWGKAIEGTTDRVGQEWTYRYKDLHFSRQRTTELTPDKVVWHVADAEMSFLKDKSEWKGTDLVFDVAPKGDKTEVRFTHAGLVPDVECYDICTNGWSGLIHGSLKSLIETGKGIPDSVE